MVKMDSLQKKIENLIQVEINKAKLDKDDILTLVEVGAIQRDINLVIDVVAQQIRDKAKLGTEIENMLDTDLEDEWKRVAEIQWVKLDDVLGLLVEKQGEK